MQDEHPTTKFGTHIEERIDTSLHFYITMNVHDKLLHNCLLNYGASHNFMLKLVMKKFGLDITKTCHELYSFDSKRVKCLRAIKDLVVTLTQLPMKSVVMDIVVVDILPKFGILLSRSWTKKLGGTLQVDMTYATIPMFGGEHRRLYRKVQLDYVINDQKNLGNHLVYVVDEDMGSYILHISNDVETCRDNVDNFPIKQDENVKSGVWKMFFDGSSSREGFGLGVVFIFP